MVVKIEHVDSVFRAVVLGAIRRDPHDSDTICGAVLAVCARMGRRSLVKRKGPMQLVPSWTSYPCAVLIPALWGPSITPALLERISSRSFSFRNVSAEDLMVERSARSRCRYISWPLDFSTRALILVIAADAFDFERAAV